MKSKKLEKALSHLVDGSNIVISRAEYDEYNALVNQRNTIYELAHSGHELTVDAILDALEIGIGRKGDTEECQEI